MSWIEGKLALDSGTAGLNLITSLLSLIKTAKDQGHDNAGLAQIMAQMPPQVFNLSVDLLHECEQLKQDF